MEKKIGENQKEIPCALMILIFLIPWNLGKILIGK